MTLNEREDILTFLANTHVDVRRLTEGLSESETHWKPSTGEFSVVENICHLRDIELDGYAVRIKKILDQDQPFLADLNGAQLAIERDYNSQDMCTALETFAEGREVNLRIIRALSPDQMKRSGRLENIDSITLERLLEMMREHDVAHIAELKTLRNQIASESVRQRD